MHTPSASLWSPTWRSPFQTHQYEPLYLANGTFGGMLDLSGVTMDLWASQLGAVPVGDAADAPWFPVTALRTQAYFRNATFRAAKSWVGATGIKLDDARFTADAAMPHWAQVYHNEQTLDLAAGVATTRGVLTTGCQAAVEPGFAPERTLPFTTRVVFLKDSALAAWEITADADTDIHFDPETVAEERFNLDVTGTGITRLGNALRCHLELRQEVSPPVTSGEAIVYRIQPHLGRAYEVHIRAPGATLQVLGGRPGWCARGQLVVFLEIRPEGLLPAKASPAQAQDQATAAPQTFAAILAEQAQRWGALWAASDITLPASEALWQERYRASLFQVAQSMGDGPTHPGGLSKPMAHYWRGCFHDTDTYFCGALLIAGAAAEARKHLDFRWRTLPQAQAIVRSEGQPGASYPWQVDPNGRGHPCHTPVNGAIIAVEAWHQHGFHGDDPSLTQALGILGETLDYLGTLLSAEGGLRSGPIMTFSENLKAEDPTEVRIALRSVAASWLAAAARAEVVDAKRAALAQRILDQLPLPVATDGTYTLSVGSDPLYLRCPSVTLGAFPLHHVAADARLAATFEKELSRILSLFAWLPHQASVVASLLQRREGPASAAGILRHADAFYKTWHAVDEWENRRTARAAVFVTGAGGFCLAIQHLLLAEDTLGTVAVFPSTPAAWQDVSFRDLRTRSGWRISAQLKGGAVVVLEAQPQHERATPELRVCLPDGSERRFLRP
jgi:hypothetical protein